MNGSTDNRASGPREKSRRPEGFLTLATAQRMLPLVRRVVSDLLEANQQLAQLVPEQERLERQRRTLAWPQRQRRYQVGEEVAQWERALQDALAELEVLGVTLLNPAEGRVGFPTMVNKRRAYFALRPGQESLRFWQFAGDTVLRPVPASWIKEAELELKGNG
jgi:hypothetical protein